MGMMGAIEGQKRLTWAQAIKSLPPATIGMEYFWTGVGVVYMA